MKQVKDFERLLDTMMDAKQKTRQEQKSQTEKENKSFSFVQKDRKRLKMDTHQKDYDEKTQHSIEMSLPPAPTISSKSLKRIRKHQEYMQKIKDREELEQLDYIVAKTKKYTPPLDSDIDEFMKKLQACSNPRDSKNETKSMEFDDFVVIEAESKKDEKQKKQANEFETVCECDGSDSDNEFIEPCFTCGDYQHATYQCSTYKTKMCWYQLRHKNQRNQPPCRVKKCIFAHDESELRTPPSIHFIQEQEE